ncbi:MAG: peptidoglycan hydrolase-like protein with peptidoglycan-binding domain [Arenicella sp.]|jgi:peptidoglycan hydrolase-like protein with peptidoglycan-binding domain
MPQNLNDAITIQQNRFSIARLSPLLALGLIMFLSACVPMKEEIVVVEQPKVVEVEKPPQFDPSPIIRATAHDVRFAQEALNIAGVKVGTVDGLWGPRSANAIRAFELENKLTSANGHLSELNLHTLEIVSGLSRESYGKLPIKTPLGILAKLDKRMPLSAGPQLIIVDHEYKVLSKPNPYSSELLKLAPGTGIYVISKQDGYFEVESINRKRGYVRID